MRIRLSELRRVVRTLVREELNVDKPYTGDLMDDEAFNSDSVLVPGDTRIVLVIRKIDRGAQDPDYELLFSDGFVNRVPIRSICDLYVRADVKSHS